MSRLTGKPLADTGGGDAHLVQSIGDILSTPIGSRVMRRDYGSALFELIDAPANPLGRLRLFAAIAIAIARWEPRLRLTRVQVAAAEGGAASGSFEIRVEGRRVDSARPNDLARLTIPLRPVISAAA